jgi:hypothetical protein
MEEGRIDRHDERVLVFRGVAAIFAENFQRDVGTIRPLIDREDPGPGFAPDLLGERGQDRRLPAAVPVNQNDVFEFIFREPDQDRPDISAINIRRDGEAPWISVHHAVNPYGITGAIIAFTRGAISFATATGARISAPFAVTPWGSIVPSGSKTVLILPGTHPVHGAHGYFLLFGSTLR